MRGVSGTRLRFDFTATRGRDAVPWVECYPGDDVVDIIGSDSYDQPEGASFGRFVDEPYGLREHARFAAEHGKPMSFPEWGLFRNSDNPEYIRGMYEWMASHNVIYQTITDYCPHGVWRCSENPRSSGVYRELFGGKGAGAPVPAPSVSTPPPGPPPQSPPPGPVPPDSGPSDSGPPVPDGGQDPSGAGPDEGGPAAPPRPETPVPPPSPGPVPEHPGSEPSVPRPASPEVTAESSASVPVRSNAPAVPAPARPSASASARRESLAATSKARLTGSSGGTRAPVPG
ncbi:hypothetical protein [Actinomadura sp. 9N407]|uniref:hypothetical protein n=1 Tax=Actinomadura sp. 9N407 TaxID=3375154 RepID=UPI00378C34FB